MGMWRFVVWGKEEEGEREFWRRERAGEAEDREEEEKGKDEEVVEEGSRNRRDGKEVGNEEKEEGRKGGRVRETARERESEGEKMRERASVNYQRFTGRLAKLTFTHLFSPFLTTVRFQRVRISGRNSSSPSILSGVSDKAA